ncbi:DNA polymerase IV [Actinospica robiniae]|uniref:DNA polymerase IV n=1 Tax=Actinospica robiniae TaxID=304901 RepID=UPI000405B467|nr:DNA polymerase IV [Actinospica robiniae]
MRTVPSILHIDMDAFFAAVEQRHKPSLRGKPVVVGGVGLRGVVSTASYEARAFGVGSAMPTALARRRCPNAAYLFPRFGAYHEISQVVMGVLREFSALVEPVSMDEAFIDLDAMEQGPPRGEDEVRAHARRLSELVRERTGLTASVGAGTSKLVAKVASDAEKPHGCVVVPAGNEQQWLDPLPVRKLWGVGPATADRLHTMGAATVGELRALSEQELVSLLGHAWGGQLYRLSRGLDERTVSADRETKSVSVEDTYPHDLMDLYSIRGAVTELAERVVRRLREGGHTGRTVTVKARGHDFTTVTRSETLAGPTDDVRLLLPAALRLVDGAAAAATGQMRGIRLLGVGISGLAEYAQGDLIAELEGLAEQADAASDEDDAEAAEAAEVPAVTLYGPVPEAPEARRWLAGQDVRHAQWGPGWVQGAGLGRVTIRLEGPDTAPGRVKTLDVADPELEPVDSAEVARAALPGGPWESGPADG